MWWLFRNHHVSKVAATTIQLQPCRHPQQQPQQWFLPVYSSCKAGTMINHDCSGSSSSSGVMRQAGAHPHVLPFKMYHKMIHHQQHPAGSFVYRSALLPLLGLHS
jgi:hypothetical protein